MVAAQGASVEWHCGWLQAVICRCHLGVIHWYSTNAARVFCGGQSAGGGDDPQGGGPPRASVSSSEAVSEI